MASPSGDPFKKIEAMVAERAGGHYSIDSCDGHFPSEEMKAMVGRASERIAKVQTRRRELKALMEGESDQRLIWFIVSCRKHH